MNATILNHRRPASGTIILVALGLVLTWLVITRSFAAYFAEVAPTKALWLNSQQPDALTNQANETLNGVSSEGFYKTFEQSQQNKSGGINDQTSKHENAQKPANAFSAFDIIDPNKTADLATIRLQAKTALLNAPLNAIALRILGQAADAAGDTRAAWGFMEAAARLSNQETAAVDWLTIKSYEMQDYKSTIDYADILLRTRPQIGNYIMPFLAAIMNRKDADNLLKSILADNPPWREQFFNDISHYVSDARAPLDILVSLRNSASPPISSEIKPYVEFLIDHKLYDLAYYTWLQFLPPEELREAGLLFDGNFNTSHSGLPFDWVIIQGSGVTVDIVPRSDNGDERALLVDFHFGRVDYHSVRELTMLSPGSYRFHGQYKGNLAGPRGLKWRIVCAPGATDPIGESPMIGGIASEWQSVDFRFEVPTTNCRAQYVRLDLDARMASEQLVSGSMMFSGLRIARLPSNQTTPNQP